LRGVRLFVAAAGEGDNEESSDSNKKREATDSASNAEDFRHEGHYPRLSRAG